MGTEVTDLILIALQTATLMAVLTRPTKGKKIGRSFMGLGSTELRKPVHFTDEELAEREAEELRNRNVSL